MQRTEPGHNLGVWPRSELAVLGAAGRAREQLHLDQLASQQAVVAEAVMGIEDLVDLALALASLGV